MLRSGRLFGCQEMPFVQLRQLLVKSFIFPVEKRKSRGQRHRKILQKNYLSEIRKKPLAN